MAARHSWSESFTPAKPNPWILRKFVIGIVLGLAAWAFYIGVARVCAPAIRSWPGAGLSRAAGIGILVAFVILWLLFVWSYIMVICTPPGFARDVVPVGEEPKEPSYASNAPMAPPSDLGESGVSGSSGTLQQPIAPPPIAVVLPSQPPPNAKVARIPRPRPYVQAGPRWCQYCNLAKPDRTHHCRQCGTCVMKFDHHCMWVGQCVGWRNHPIFLVFNFWAGMFCVFNFAILVASLALASKVDVQKAVMAGISGFFGVFTLGAMLPTHLYLILVGRSTIESFQSRDQSASELAALRHEFHIKFFATKEMRETVKLWENEFGGVVPNDRWKWGTPWLRWKDEMGSNPLGWILPIGRPHGDGIHFKADPRFGPNGEWLPVRDWPKVMNVSDKIRANLVYS